MSTAGTKWRCNDCKTIVRHEALLVAPNPFDATETVVGCPTCKCVGDFTEICDEPGCMHPASGGTPTPTGYRRTCHEHWPGA